MWVIVSFRLLTEYHSFLFYTPVKQHGDYCFTCSFRLLTEYHSFLLNGMKAIEKYLEKFPSPYGVSFILIYLS